MKVTKRDLELAKLYAVYNMAITDIAEELFGDRTKTHSAYIRMCRALKVLYSKQYAK